MTVLEDSPNILKGLADARLHVCRDFPVSQQGRTPDPWTPLFGLHLQNICSCGFQILSRLPSFPARADTRPLDTPIRTSPSEHMLLWLSDTFETSLASPLMTS